MAIEDIFRALEEQGETEVRESIEAAREQARGVEEDANAEAVRIREAKVESARAHVESRRARTINAAHLDARRELAAVKQNAIDTAFDDALEQLASVRGTSGYAAMFAALAVEALEGVSGDVVLVVSPADEAPAKAALAASGLTGTIDASADTRGGLTVLADAGTMMRRNTIEDRTAKYRSAGQPHVAEVLFA